MAVSLISDRALKRLGCRHHSPISQSLPGKKLYLTTDDARWSGESGQFPPQSDRCPPLVVPSSAAQRTATSILCRQVEC